MTNIIDVKYQQTGDSTNLNKMGMRDMQARAYTIRDKKYILIKAPPASGKSRALMFLALDKIKKQGLKKAIVAVPERSIGGSFQSIPLTKDGFFADWKISEGYNLCLPGVEESKVEKLIKFLDDKEEILICTHATLRFACDKINPEKFNNCLVAIDEFHHVASTDDSKLGIHLKNIMSKSSAHIVAMTGSYFRGDSVPILSPEDEALFSKVTYNYYEQLNGYTYLKSLGIGYHFYQGDYLSAVHEVLNTDKKTILHIPSVNSGEANVDKHEAVDRILDSIGNLIGQDETTGVLKLKRKSDGKIILVADLVNDNPKERERIVNYLREITKPEEMDLIIALGMAKEGFDWAFCEHALTIGYRGSLTEVIQIIGRCTRDSSNKEHAQFTNLVAEPDAKSGDVADAVNNMLKAITCSLLMEQVLAPIFKFKPKVEGEKPKPGEIQIKGLNAPKTEQGKQILENDMADLKATILQNEEIQKAIAGLKDSKYVTQELIPRIIREKYPDLDEDDVQVISHHHNIGSVFNGGEFKTEGNKQFIKLAEKFINIEDLDIDLIESMNPFQRAYEILSKSVNADVLKQVQIAITTKKTPMTLEEAKYLFPRINEFVEEHNREPNPESNEPVEAILGRALAYLRRAMAENK